MAKTSKPLGAVVAPATTGPESLRGQTISIDFRHGDFLELPSRKYRLTHDAPTMVVPAEPGAMPDLDLVVLWNCLKAGEVVLGQAPVPARQKQPDRISRFLDPLKLDLDEETVGRLVTQVVNGPFEYAGYTKIEILEAMIKAEEKNPVTGRGGRDRPPVKRILREALDHVIRSYGGVSSVVTEGVDMKEGPAPSPAPAVSGLSQEELEQIVGL